jgi:tripartite-type tricarboxylate transporter receptor subunit TctC
MAPPALPGEIRNILVKAFKRAMDDREFQTWAKKIDLSLTPLFGDEAEKEALRRIRYYQQDVKPIVLKYAK